MLGRVPEKLRGRFDSQLNLSISALRIGCSAEERVRHLVVCHLDLVPEVVRCSLSDASPSTSCGTAMDGRRPTAAVLGTGGRGMGPAREFVSLRVELYAAIRRDARSGTANERCSASTGSAHDAAGAVSYWMVREYVASRRPPGHLPLGAAPGRSPR